MKKQLILGIDLYENALTEKQGGYAGKPHITGTLRPLAPTPCPLSREEGMPSDSNFPLSIGSRESVTF